MKSRFINKIIIVFAVCIANIAAAQTSLNIDNGGQMIITGGAQVVVSGGVNLKTNSSYINIANGTLKISGEIQGPGSIAGNVVSNLILEGTGNGTLNFTPGYTILNNFTLDRVGSSVILNSPLTITGTLSLQNGILKTSSTNLPTLGTNGLSTGILAYSNGQINGPFRRWFSNTTNVGISGDFPVGDDVTNGVTRYNARIEFTTPPTSAGTLTGEWIPGNPGEAGLPLVDGALNLQNVTRLGYWRIDKGNGLTGGVYKSSLTANAFLGVFDYLNLRSVKRPSGGGNWTLDGTAGINTGSNALAVVVRNGEAGFSEFAIAGAADNPLSNAGKIDPAITEHCYIPNSGTLTLIDYYGVIIGWEESTDNGLTWIPNGNTTSSQSYNDLLVTTWYRVLVKYGAYPAEYSDVAQVIIHPLPTPVITSNTGSFIFCNHSSIILDAGTFTSYIWSTGATTHNIATNSGSTYTVTVTDIFGCTASTSVTTVRLLSVPAKPGTIFGPVSGLCNSSGNVYSISPVATAAYYQWTVTNGIITSGQGTTSITVDYFGFNSSTITVRAQNACGYSSSRTLTVTGKPSPPLTIHGNKNGVCKKLGEKYSVDAVYGATNYRWTVPSGVVITTGQGTTDIEVNFLNSFSSGNICCRAENSCGNSAYTCLSVSGKPQKPVTIFGPTSVCRNQSGLVYSTPSVYGATSYIWTVPSGAIIQSGQGTASITVKFGTHSGLVEVWAKNSCGTSSDFDLNVRIVCRETGDITLGEVNVYPNPTHGNLNVSISSDLNQKCSIRIIDVIGKQLMFDTFILAEGSNLQQYDVNGYASGLYFMVIERDGMQSETIRVVIE